MDGRSTPQVAQTRSTRAILFARRYGCPHLRVILRDALRAVHTMPAFNVVSAL